MPINKKIKISVVKKQFWLTPYKLIGQSLTTMKCTTDQLMLLYIHTT